MLPLTMPCTYNSVLVHNPSQDTLTPMADSSPAPTGPATAAGGSALRQAVTEEMLGIVGAPFALAGRLVEEAGFDAIYLSSAAFSAGALGVPDIGLFTRDQLVEQTRILARAVTIPVVVDADTGFGGPRDVEETVRLLEAAGARQSSSKTSRPTSGAATSPGSGWSSRPRCASDWPQPRRAAAIRAR